MDKNFVFVVLILSAVSAIWYQNQHPKEFHISIIQNNKTIGYSTTMDVLRSGCTSYYTKEGIRIGNVCGNFRTEKMFLK